MKVLILWMVFLSGVLSSSLIYKNRCIPSSNGNGMYCFNKTATSFDDAEDSCRRAGGHLASVHDLSTNLLLKVYGIFFGLKRFWLGGIVVPNSLGAQNISWSDNSKVNFERPWAYVNGINERINMVANSPNDGLWKANNRKVKLPSVCFIPSVLDACQNYCPPGYTCVNNGRCAWGKYCTSSGDCQFSDFCLNYWCYVPCNTLLDCGGGEYFEACINHVCVVNVCPNGNKDCPLGSKCDTSTHLCVGYCENGYDCPDDLPCFNNQCGLPPCEFNSNCNSSSYVCQNGWCVNYCESDSNCDYLDYPTICLNNKCVVSPTTTTTSTTTFLPTTKTTTTTPAATTTTTTTTSTTTFIPTTKTTTTNPAATTTTTTTPHSPGSCIRYNSTTHIGDDTFLEVIYQLTDKEVMIVHIINYISAKKSSNVFLEVNNINVYGPHSCSASDKNPEETCYFNLSTEDPNYQLLMRTSIFQDGFNMLKIVVKNEQIISPTLNPQNPCYNETNPYNYPPLHPNTLATTIFCCADFGTTINGCTSCTVDQVTLKLGNDINDTPTGTLGTANGCSTFTVTCTANSNVFMQFNGSIGGPEGVQGNGSINAVLMCANGDWTYTQSGVTLVIKSVECLGGA